MAAVSSIGRATGLEPLAVAVDSHAEEALYQRNSSRVLGFCLSRLRRREDAEDALQTTFLYAFRSLRRGVVPLVESAWLLGIARNVCVERWEAAGKRSKVETPVDPAELARNAPALDDRPDELIGLDEALTHLPEQQRRAVLLRDWRGLSYEEVAEDLGVSHAAVETMIFRGRRNLAEYLRDGARTTKRRLASLGNLGGLASALKTAFSGSAAATKIAAAVTVVAVSGAGVAVGETTLRGGGSEPVRPAEPLRAPAAGRPDAVAPATTLRPRATNPAAAAPGSKAGRRHAAPSGDTSSPPGARAAVGQSPPAAGSAAATPAPAPTSSTHRPVPPAVKEPVRTVGETVKKATSKVPLPPVLAETTKKVDEVVGSLPAVPPVVGTVEDTAAPVVGAVEDVAAPVLDPVLEPVDEVLPDPPATPPVPPVPPLLP